MIDQKKPKKLTSRLVVDMSYLLHSAIKIKAIKNKQSIREYILELLRKDGVY